MVFCDWAENVGRMIDSGGGLSSRELPYVKGREECEELVDVELVGTGDGDTVTTDGKPVPAMNGLKALREVDGKPYGAEEPPVGPVMGKVILPNGSGLKRGEALELDDELEDDCS